MARGACYRMSVHEIIALEQRIAARGRRNAPVRPFSLERIRPERFLTIGKHPSKARELRPCRPVARREARLHPVAERTGLVDKLAHRVRRAGKLRLFRMWKLVGKHRGEIEAVSSEHGPEAPPPPVRPLAERLAWLRRTRRL